jgi:hypothetical protein
MGRWVRLPVLLMLYPVTVQSLGIFDSLPSIWKKAKAEKNGGKGGSRSAGTAAAASAAVVSNVEAVKLSWCEESAAQHGVKPGTSWGTLPIGGQRKWKNNGCDVFLKKHSATMHQAFGHRQGSHRKLPDAAHGGFVSKVPGGHSGPSGPCQPFTVTPSTDFFGNDLHDGHVTGVGKYQECCRKCADKAGCYGFVFVQGGRECWLKSGASPPIKKGGVVGGIRHFVGALEEDTWGVSSIANVSHHEEPWKWCLMMRHKHNVVAGGSWGSLAEHDKRRWIEADCNMLAGEVQYTLLSYSLSCTLSCALSCTLSYIG